MKKTILCLLLALCLCLCLVFVSCSPDEDPTDSIVPVPGVSEGEKKGEVAFSPDAGGTVGIVEPNQQVNGETALH